MTDSPPDLVLDPDRTTTSVLHDRAVFVLASPESGGDLVADALGCLPGVTSAPVPTHLFSDGMARLLNTWLSRIRPAIGSDTDDQTFLLHARLLADAVLSGVPGYASGDLLVEYSPDHAARARAVAALYPDATIIHVVRDGRHVVQALVSPLHACAPGAAARRWCDDQRTVLAAGHVRICTVRIEDVLGDPGGALPGILRGIGLDVPDGALRDTEARLGSGTRLFPVRPSRRSDALVEVLGDDLLEHFGYPVPPRARWRRGVAQLEVGTAGDIVWAARAAIARARAAGSDE